MKNIILISVLLLITQSLYGAQSNDAINVPYLGDLDIIGYKLGDNLSTALEKSDLHLSGDYGYQQIFTVAQPSKRSIKQIDLFYVKQRGRGQTGGNRLYQIHIKYSNEHTDRIMLKLALPTGYKRKVLMDQINQYGIYQYKVAYEIRDSFSEGSYTVQVDLADRPDGQLWVDYYIEAVRNRIRELE